MIQVVNPTWGGWDTSDYDIWDTSDYDIWVPDPVPTVLDRVKEFEKRSPGIFVRNVGRTTAAVYRTCERVVAGESLVYVVGNEHDANRVTQMARRFLVEEFKAKFYYRQSFGDFVVTCRGTPDGKWGPREHIAGLAVRVCATIKDYEDLRYGQGEVAFANDYGEWASEHMKRVAKFETRIKDAETKAEELTARFQVLEGDRAELRASLQASEERAANAEKEALALKAQAAGHVRALRESLQASEKLAEKVGADRSDALVRLSDMRHAIRRAMGDESEVMYGTYARAAVAKGQGLIGVQAACSCEDAGDVLP
jgi:hypothetical protein